MGNPFVQPDAEEGQSDIHDRAREARRLLEDFFEQLPALMSFTRSSRSFDSLTEPQFLEQVQELHRGVDTLEQQVFPPIREVMYHAAGPELMETFLLDILLMRVARLFVAHPTGRYSMGTQTAALLEVAGAEQAISTARSMVNTWQSRRGGGAQRTERVARLLETVRQQRQHVRSMVFEYLVGRDGPWRRDDISGRRDDIPEAIATHELVQVPAADLHEQDITTMIR